MVKHLFDLIDPVTCFHMENFRHQILQQMSNLFRHPVAFAILISDQLQLIVIEIPRCCKRGQS